MYAWLMHLMSKMFGNTAKKNMEKNITDNAIAEGNWMGPDGTESGPGVPEDWYLSYEGPAPVVEGINAPNYVVDRGIGTIPIEFYAKKWGVPEGFEEETKEALKEVAATSDHTAEPLFK